MVATWCGWRWTVKVMEVRNQMKLVELHLSGKTQAHQCAAARAAGSGVPLFAQVGVGLPVAGSEVAVWTL